MRTNEEREKLIYRRVAEIKEQQKRKKQMLLEGISIAACLILICAAGIGMPDLAGSGVGNNMGLVRGTASLVANHEQIGYIMMGILSFLLGMGVTILLYRLKHRSKDEHNGEEDDGEF